MDKEEVNKIIDEKLKDFILIDKYTFKKHTQIFDGRNIQTGRTTGTKIGTATDQKLGFYGTTPVDQPSNVTTIAETGADQDGALRIKFNQLLAILQELGLMA